MNSKIKRIAYAMATALLLAACTQDEAIDNNTLPEGKYPLEIASVTMSVESSSEPWGANAPQTRVSESEDRNSSVWDGGEEISVQITNGNETAIYTLQDDKTTLTSSKPLYWKNMTASKVRAWYPADGYVILSNQTTDTGLAYALFAETENEVDYDTPNISLPFEHKLAKVRVILDGDQAGQVTSVRIKTKTSCTIHADGTVTAGDAESYISMVQTTYNSGEKCWEANVVPGHPITDFQVNETEGKLNGEGITPLEAKVNTIILTVGRIIVKDGEAITEPGDYTMSGEYAQGVMLNGDGITLTMDGAVVHTSDIGINVESGSPTIKVSGTGNSVTSDNTTAININQGATLTIEGVNGTADKLTAKAGKIEGFGSGTAGAGIGSSNGGNIIIRNISIEAEGNSWTHFLGYLQGGGAAIGTAAPGYCGDITITDATISATGGHYAAAIGMGYSAEGSEDSNLKMGTIRINNSIITAKGGEGASAIGFPYLGTRKNPTAGMIYIETNESSSTFLNRLTITSGEFKIGKGSFIASYNSFYGTDGGTWPGVTLKASDGTQTSPDGIGQ